MNGKTTNSDNKNIKKVTFTIKTKKIFNIDDIDVNKILVSKKNNMANIIHLNTLLGIMIMVLLDHYIYFCRTLLAALINVIKTKYQCLL